jgi:hypothetical protein
MASSEYSAESDVVEGGGRLGLLAKGVSYALVAILAIQVAVRGSGRPEDREGALQAVGDEPFGGVLIAVLAAGFAGYALWRFAQAFFDRNSKGKNPKGLAKRAGSFGKGLLYTALCLVCVSILAGSGSGAGDEQKTAARVLELPLGRWLVGLVGVGFLVAAGYNVFRALTRKFEDDLHIGRLNKAQRRSVTISGIVGHLARGIVFALVGFFVARAAWQYDPEEAVGLDGALAKLIAESYGSILLGAVAAGLLAYGAFCFVQARYREV